MKFPSIKGRRWPVIVLLLALGIPIVLAGIFALSFPSLAAPTKPIPALNYQDNQLQLYNVTTKLKAGFLSMFQTGSGRGTMELSETEVNALLAQGLSQGLNADYRFVGSSTRFVGDRIYVDAAIEWQGKILGPELVLKTQASRGYAIFYLEEARLGELPLPKFLLSRYLALHLPQGFVLNKQPLSLAYDPNVLLSQVNLPLIKNPSLAIENLGLTNNKLRLTALLSFRLGF